MERTQNLDMQEILHAAAHARITDLTNGIIDAHGSLVMSGPFAQMDIPVKSSWGDKIAKLLGCYEAELHPYLEHLIARQPDVVVNVGCAEGYYAIGLARRLPGAQVFAFDIDEAAQQICAGAAETNGVGDRVIVGGLCDTDILIDLAALSPNMLVLMDCEGGERDLLTPAVVEALKNADILVETHDFLDRTITPNLAALLSQNHDVGIVHEGARDPSKYPILHHLNSLDRWLTMCEFRPELMSWLVAVGKR